MARRRKQESASSPTFFIDRCLGSLIVADQLRAIGAAVEVHDAHFPKDHPDELWIREVTDRGWAILTKDRAIRYRVSERDALVRSGAAAFILTAGDTTAAENAEAFANALPKMVAALKKYGRPLIATVARSGTVAIKQGERRGGVRRD